MVCDLSSFKSSLEKIHLYKKNINYSGIISATLKCTMQTIQPFMKRKHSDIKKERNTRWTIFVVEGFSRTCLQRFSFYLFIEMELCLIYLSF